MMMSTTRWVSRLWGTGRVWEGRRSPCWLSARLCRGYGGLGSFYIILLIIFHTRARMQAIISSYSDVPVHRVALMSTQIHADDNYLLLI